MTKKILASVFALLSIGAAGTLIVLSTDNKPTSQNSDDVKTTSESVTAQAEFNEGDYREPGNTIGENDGYGFLTDNNGAIGNNANAAKPIVSSTGEITVYSPQLNARLTSGYEISGLSSLETVHFRLGDDASGQIANGLIKVVNGKFSGNITFNANSSSGQLDLFGVKNDGVEYSNVEIPIEYQ